MHTSTQTHTCNHPPHIHSLTKSHHKKSLKQTLPLFIHSKAPLNQPPSLFHSQTHEKVTFKLKTIITKILQDFNFQR